MEPPSAGNASTDGCELRLIVALDSAPDAALLRSLSDASGAQLELVRAMPANLYLLFLSSDGAAANCTTAAEKLRSDPRVLSVDVDTRREIARP